jgi:hypothetical protein
MALAVPVVIVEEAVTARQVFKVLAQTMVVKQHTHKQVRVAVAVAVERQLKIITLVQVAV